VGLFVGFGWVLISWLVCLGLSTAIGLDLYWPMAAAWALWAALDSRRLQLERFERVFPLQPLPLAISVLFLWPISLPWYFHLKAKAASGALAVPQQPSRIRYVLVGLAAMVPLVVFGSNLWLTRSPVFGPLRAAEIVLSQEPQTMRLNYNTKGTLTVSVQNPTIPLSNQEAEARRLASLVAAAVDSFHSVKAVSIGFVRVSGTAGVTYTRSEGMYSWPLEELVGRPGSPYKP
jgi:hypothetical protein